MRASKPLSRNKALPTLDTLLSYLIRAMEVSIETKINKEKERVPF